MKFTEDNVIDYILASIPEFQEEWQKHLEYWKADKYQKTIGTDITCFLEFTIDNIEANNKILILRIFNAIEEILNNCDEELEGVIYLFYLESLTNVPEKVSEYLPLLGPKSKQLCRDLDKFWGTKTPGIYDKKE